MNKIYLTSDGQNWIYSPVGAMLFVNRWKNFVYNFMGDSHSQSSFQPASGLPFWHARINKKQFIKYLTFALKIQIRLKYRNLSLGERKIKLKKILDFYLNRVFEIL